MSERIFGPGGPLHAKAREAVDAHSKDAALAFRRQLEAQESARKNAEALLSLRASLLEYRIELSRRGIRPYVYRGQRTEHAYADRGFLIPAAEPSEPTPPAGLPMSKWDVWQNVTKTRETSPYGNRKYYHTCTDIRYEFLGWPVGTLGTETGAEGEFTCWGMVLLQNDHVVRVKTSGPNARSFANVITYSQFSPHDVTICGLPVAVRALDHKDLAKEDQVGVTPFSERYSPITHLLEPLQVTMATILEKG